MVVAIRICVVEAQVPMDLLGRVIDAVPDTATRDRLEELEAYHGSPAEAAGRFGASGHVVDAVPLALFIAQSTAWNSVETVVRRAIAGGGDTDTIASLSGFSVGALR